jgi:hypothetical protein
MQSLVDAIRSTGARQPVALSGIDWANNLGSWLEYRPRDPRRNLVAEFHVYNFSACNKLNCWRKTLLPVARESPIVTSEVGEDDCRGGFLDTYLPFAARTGISYVAWAWNNWQRCSALITNYAGVPTAYGFVYREDLRQPQSVQSISDTAPEAGKPAAGGTFLVALMTAGGAAIVALCVVMARFLRRRRPRSPSPPSRQG